MAATKFRFAAVLAAAAIVLGAGAGLAETGPAAASEHGTVTAAGQAAAPSALPAGGNGNAKTDDMGWQF
ncbi:hypothetical protein AB0O91_32985 [Kitasatospora sp. NPDC089797]|uniref:hypothetical protein n=1 Tax=Kitasatospora sp. NPDC089797 TaxID=3155298 RepID=UPI003418CB44